MQNYPNPFNPATTIKFTIASPDRIGTMQSTKTSLKIYDLLGREIHTLLNKTLRPGTHEMRFDADNLPSGVYYYKLTFGQFTETKKMLLVK